MQAGHNTVMLQFVHTDSLCNDTSFANSKQITATVQSAHIPPGNTCEISAMGQQRCKSSVTVNHIDTGQACVPEPSALPSLSAVFRLFLPLLSAPVDARLLSLAALVREADGARWG